MGNNKVAASHLAFRERSAQEFQKRVRSEVTVKLQVQVRICGKIFDEFHSSMRK